eukprot:CAMPEP_0175202736 /NCGR_PEP_ID=MMETSP0093-20121207/10706_1 /TAXON_ID=311494 /ORGANISM="Alexandrium monilatum, Strain CCMP3105" /LENGTH=103 /DNA_ID=CAMNT_0016495789 /DNA_START=130 /DNA_END=437 /DNA_ORIENTATION=+
MWRPLRFASKFFRTRDRECIFTALRMMRPSLISFRMLKREFAMEISLVSFGSNHILPLPHFFTEAARRFCNLRDMTAGTEGPAEGSGDESSAYPVVTRTSELA